MIVEGSGSFQLSNKPKEDGIHPDGSFLQHNGILYNGNYGKDLVRGDCPSTIPQALNS